MTSLFIVYGEKDGRLVTDPTPPLVHAIDTKPHPGLRLQTQVIAGAGHAPAESLERGLRFVFEPALGTPSRPVARDPDPARGRQEPLLAGSARALRSRGGRRTTRGVGGGLRTVSPFMPTHWQVSVRRLPPTGGATPSAS